MLNKLLFAHIFFIRVIVTGQRQSSLRLKLRTFGLQIRQRTPILIHRTPPKRELLTQMGRMHAPLYPYVASLSQAIIMTVKPSVSAVKPTLRLNLSAPAPNVLLTGLAGMKAQLVLVETPGRFNWMTRTI